MEYLETKSWNGGLSKSLIPIFQGLVDRHDGHGIFTELVHNRTREMRDVLDATGNTHCLLVTLAIRSLPCDEHLCRDRVRGKGHGAEAPWTENAALLSEILAIGIPASFYSLHARVGRIQERVIIFGIAASHRPASSGKTQEKNSKGAAQIPEEIYLHI